MKQSKIYTPAKFAKKVGIGRATIWRWLTNKHLEPRLKMHDAKRIVIAGKNFIEHSPL